MHECGRLALKANIEDNQEAVAHYIEKMEQASVDVIKYVDVLLNLDNY